MWERCRDLVEAAGTKVVMGSGVTAIRHRDGQAVSVVATATNGGTTEYTASAVISSMPLSALIKVMDPPAPPAVRQAAADLAYRDYLTVALVVPLEAGFPDNWIYIHEPGVDVGRIQNYGSWSPFLVKEGRTCLGMEYFVFEGDAMWNKSDEDLVAQGKAELAKLGLVEPSRVEAGYVVRVPKAYPYYDPDYKANVETIREWLDASVPNVHPVGRNGMHRYNNQDHSMYTAMLTVENLFGANHNVWEVNVEEEYHEEHAGSGDSLESRAAAPVGPAPGASSSPGTGRDAPILPKRTPA
jgi:protoporphyrinogen oxidase